MSDDAPAHKYRVKYNFLMVINGSLHCQSPVLLIWINFNPNIGK